MSGYQLPISLRTPSQAADIFSQFGRYPKQRHVFMVRFQKGHWVADPLVSKLGYVVKSCDRPSIQPHFEEVNQYNKKRHVLTGYKTQPVKITFYDSADGSAQRLWYDYSKYHFGDFAQYPAAYEDDIYASSMLDPTGAGYGITAKNSDPYYFSSIQIFHFYSNTYDIMTLVNPRITSFDPHELSYGESTVSTIDMQFSFDAVITNIAAGSAMPASELDEFNGEFNGNTVEVSGYAGVNSGLYSPQQLGQGNYGASVDSLMGWLQNAVAATTGGGFASSLSPSLSSSALSVFGNFDFGTGKIGGTKYGATIGAGLASSALNNSSLAAYLGLSYNTDSGLSGSLPLSGQSQRGMGMGVSPMYSSISGMISAATGVGGSIVASRLGLGMMGSSALGDIGGSLTSNGLSLSPTAYGVINSGQPSTAQYGYNSGSGLSEAQLLDQLSGDADMKSARIGLDNAMAGLGLTPTTQTDSDSSNSSFDFSNLNSDV